MVNLTQKVYKYSKLYMYDKPDQLCRPPCKRHMANRILFEKEIDFCTTFMSAIGQSTWEDVLILQLFGTFIMSVHA